MRSRDGVGTDSLTDLIMWVLLIVLAGFSLWLLFKKFGIR